MPPAPGYSALGPQEPNLCKYLPLATSTNASNYNKSIGKERTRIAEERFEEFKKVSLGLACHAVRWEPYWGTCPKGDDASCLRALVAIVKKERKQLREIEDHPILKSEREQRERAQESRERQALRAANLAFEHRQQIESIKLPEK